LILLYTSFMLFQRAFTCFTVRFTSRTACTAAAACSLASFLAPELTCPSHQPLPPVLTTQSMSAMLSGSLKDVPSAAFFASAASAGESSVTTTSSSSSSSAGYL